MIANSSPSERIITLAGWDFGGDGPIALLHHANGLCGACWAPVARALTRRYRVIAIDARGHGRSEHLNVPQDYAWSFFVDDLVRIATKLKAEFDQPLALGLGSSFGGIVICGAQAKAPGLFESIVMLDPPIHPSQAVVDTLGLDLTPADESHRGQLVRQTLKRKAIWLSRTDARAAWRDKPLFKPWQDETFELYLAYGLADRADGQVELACSPEVEAHIFATTGSLGVLDYAPHVDAHVKLVHATQGHFDETYFRALATLFPDCQFEQMVGGHMLPLEVPDTVNKFLEDI
jgi:pimeloyl-ACP methyl ester carboxylesterase